MQFDGMKARFQRDVVAQQIEPLRTQTIHTPVLEVTMHDRVDFSANGHKEISRIGRRWN